MVFFFFSSRRRHTRFDCDWSSDVCSSDLAAVDARSALFALGALLYESLTGKPAFSGGSVIDIGAQIIHFNPPPPSSINHRVPAELDRITLKALAKKPEARYQSCSELVRDLRAAR